MSYSFHFSAKDRDEAKARCGEEFNKVLRSQPIHQRDRQQALAAAEAMIDLCADPTEGQVVNVNMSGSLTYRGNENAADITGASVQVQANVGPIQKMV